MSRLAILEQMEARQPEDAFVKYALATEHISLGDDASALTYFLILVDKFPDYLPTYLHLGMLYERMEQITEATDAYKKGIEVAKKNGDKKTLGELNEALMLLED